MRRLVLGGLIISGLMATVTSAAIADDLSVKLVSITAPVVSGEPATLILQTEPGASCQAEFTAMRGGQYGSFKRGPTTANSDGQVHWSFTYKIEGRPRVQFQANVTCASGDRKGTLLVPFDVTM
jgi:hypothetical protein